MKAVTISVLVIAGFVFPALTSCGDDAKPGAEGEEACLTDFAGLESEPSVSFRNDVMPIFAGSCASSNSCHNGDGREAGLYLGEKNSVPLTDAIVGEAHAAIVGKPSLTVSRVLLVAPGDPDASFLMDKLLDRQNDRGYACEAQSSATGCGDVMPQRTSMCRTGSGAAKVNTIARWIAQSAPNN